MIVKGGTFGPVATNTYVVADAQGGSALIVDPAAGSREWVQQTLARLEVEPTAVWDTHGHWDHVVENHIWAEDGVPVWCGAGDEDWVRAPAPFNPALFGNPPPTPGVEPDRIFGHDERLDCGTLSFELIHTPGHSPGCWVAHDPAAGQALVGDLIFAQGVGRTDFPGSDPAAMLASLERVLALPGETVIYPGHGPWAGTLAEAEPHARMFMR